MNATARGWEEDEIQPSERQNRGWEEEEIQPVTPQAPEEPGFFSLGREKGGELMREKIRGFAGEAAGGFIRASAGLEGLAAGALENVWDVGKIAVRESYKAITGTPEAEMTPFERTDFLTKDIRPAEEELLRKVLPEKRTGVGKTVGRIAEYGAPVAAVTRLLTRKGAQYLKDPAKMAEKGLKRKFQERLADAAKDPRAQQLMEQKISAVMATVGQTAEEMGAPVSVQMGAEIVSAVLAGTLVNTGKSIWAWIARKSPTELKKTAKEEAVKYLKDIAGEDPNFMKKLEEGIKLQKETGVEMNLGQLADNDELKIAFMELNLTEPGGATRLANILGTQTKKIKEIAPRDTAVKDAGYEALETERTLSVAEIESRATKALDDVIEKIESSSPADRVAMGEAGQAGLDAARESAKTKVSALYDEVGNITLQTDEIVKGVNNARSSPLKGDPYMNELDAEMRSVLEKNVLGKVDQKIIKAPRKNIKLRGQGRLPKEMTLEQVRLLESRIKERIRAANADGKRIKSAMLNKILDGIFKQYDATTGVDAAVLKKLRTAAEASKKFHGIFSQGEVLAASKIDVQGIDKITAQGFVRNFIKSNLDSKMARANEAVDNFYNAYGDMPEARNWMANSFGALLKEKFPDITKANPKIVQKFIENHSDFLKRAKIADRFKSVSKAVKEAADADAAKVLDANEFKVSALGRFLNADDPVKFINNAVGTKAFDKIIASANRIKNKTRREYILKGIRETVWDGVLGAMETGKKVGGEAMLDITSITKAFENPEHAAKLFKALGPRHANNLKTMMSLIDRVTKIGGKAVGLPEKHIDGELAAKLLTGLRAAAHGFVRPDLIAAQMAARGMKAMTIKESQAILKEALSNPKFAKELLDLSITSEGKLIIKSMFSPVVAEIAVQTSDEE